jgi:hypothetical protein
MIMKMFKTMVLGFSMAALMSMTLVQMAYASVPFKGNGNAQITNVQPGPNGGDLITASASGQATHLGNYTRVENILVNQGGITGDVTFTAANGDQLTAEIDGAFISPTTAAGTYSFTGGTGRFANASGTAYFSVSLTGPGTFIVEFNGSLDN